MVSVIATDKFTDCDVRSYDFDPNATAYTASPSTYLALEDWGKVLVSFFRTVGTGNTLFRIVAATSSTGAGVTAVKNYDVSTIGQPNAVGDYCFIQATAEEIKSVLATATHVSTQVSFQTSTDEGVVTVIRAAPRYAVDGVPADYIST